MNLLYISSTLFIYLLHYINLLFYFSLPFYLFLLFYQIRPEIRKHEASCCGIFEHSLYRFLSKTRKGLIFFMMGINYFRTKKKKPQSFVSLSHKQFLSPHSLINPPFCCHHRPQLLRPLHCTTAAPRRSSATNLVTPGQRRHRAMLGLPETSLEPRDRLVFSPPFESVHHHLGPPPGPPCFMELSASSIRTDGCPNCSDRRPRLG